MRSFVTSGIAAAGLVLSGMAASAQAGVVTTVLIKDGLTTSISVSGTPNILGTVTPSLSPVGTGATNTNYIVSPYTTIASAHFSYASGSKTCRFDTSLTVVNGIPSWTKQATSTGGTYANCGATITAVDLSTYNYTVQFTMQ